MQNKEQVHQQMFDNIERWQQSGLTQKAFCQQVNLSYHIFHYWYKRYRTKDNKTTDGFINVGITAGPVTSHTELLLPDGKRLFFHQPVSVDYLKALIN